MRWHGMHFLNEVSPAATSCANAPADDATTITPASTNPFIVPLLAVSRQSGCGRAPNPFVRGIGTVRMAVRSAGVNHQFGAPAGRGAPVRNEPGPAQLEPGLVFTFCCTQSSITLAISRLFFSIITMW